MQESNPLIKAKRRAGRVKRWMKRKWWERNIGKEYRVWLAESELAEPGSIDNSIPIAVIVPVYNPPVRFLDECLTSVLKQSAQHWQLIVSDDGSTSPDVIDYLDTFAQTHAGDERVVVLRNSNGGISTACNRGMEAVTTEYFGWLDHDDCLNPRAIEIFSERLAAQADVQIIYSDEDKINTKGEHFELYCKPDFSPELLLTQMYLCHFTAFRTELARRVGGFRPEMDGAQDFDLALRLLPQLQENCVVHVPLPLYHWRAWAESTALTIDAKPWAQQAGQRAQQAFLDANFGGGTAEPSRVPGLNEVHPNIATSRVSVIIPTIGTKNTSGTKRFVDDAVASLRAKETNTPFEVIVVSTGEIDPVTDVDAQVVYSPVNGNFNFAEAINLGRSQAHGEYLLLLNDDTTVVEENPITRMMEIGQLDGVGIVGAKLTYPDGRLQHVGMVLLPSGPTHVQIAKAGKEPGYFGSTLTPRNFSAVTAAAMLVRTSVFDEVNGFDTQFARDFNDVDFCLRVRESGYRVAWTPYAHLTHHEGASIVRKASDPAEQRLFAQRWSEKYPVDPYYSPALNQDLQRAYEAL